MCACVIIVFIFCIASKWHRCKELHVGILYVYQKVRGSVYREKMYGGRHALHLENAAWMCVHITESYCIIFTTLHNKIFTAFCCYYVILGINWMTGVLTCVHAVRDISAKKYFPWIFLHTHASKCNRKVIAFKEDYKDFTVYMPLWVHCIGQFVPRQ